MGTLRHFNLQQFIQDFNCKFLVETGTYKGDSVDYAMQFGFDKIYSIELYDKLAIKAQEKFKKYKHIEIIHDSSSNGLKSILDELNGNCIFWLDAHFPGSDLGEKGYNDEKDTCVNLPLLEELKIISERVGKFDDVILIDDLRLFVDVPSDVQSAWRMNPHQGVDTFDNHMVRIGQREITRKSLVHFDLIKEIENLYGDYKITELWRSEGYLIINKK